MWPGTSGFVMVVAISQLSTKVTYGFYMVFFIYGPTLQLTLRTYILGWVSTSKTVFGHWTRIWCQELRNTSPFTLLYSNWKFSAFAAHLLPHQAWRTIFFLGYQHLESICCVSYWCLIVAFILRHDCRYSIGIFKHLYFDDLMETWSAQHHLSV